MVRLGRNIEIAGTRQNGWCPHRSAVRGLDLRQCLGVNVGIYLGELEQVFTVVASLGVVVGGHSQPEITFQSRTDSLLSVQVRHGRIAVAESGSLAREHNDRSVQAHLDLQIPLGSAVIGARPRSPCSETVSYRRARCRLLREQAGCTIGERLKRKAGKEN